MRAPFLEDKKNYGDVTRVFFAVDFFGKDSDMEAVAKAGSDAQVSLSLASDITSSILKFGFYSSFLLRMGGEVINLGSY